MNKELCFFVGGVKSPAIQNLIKNLGWMLSENFDLTLISTQEKEFEFAERYYTVYDESHHSTFSNGILSLKKYFQRHDPLVVTQLTQPPTHGTIVGSLASKFDTPFVYRYSGDRFYGYRVRQGWRKWGTFMIDNMIGRIPLYIAKKYIALGPTGKARLVDRGVPPSEITILPPGVDPSRFSHHSVPRINLNVPEDRSIVLFLGRCNRLKGLGTLERTIPSIIDRRSDIHLVLVGSGDSVLHLPPDYRDHVTTVGQVPPDQVPAYLRRADLLVHPSLTEGVPRAVLEALFTNTPVVARAVGDIPFVTTNTFSGDDEFIEMVCDFETLEVDEPSRFRRENLKQDYNRFYSEF
jgi:glycosyltransferase involved in cell wall biosynthesis